MSTIKLGIIGTGGMAAGHADNYQRIKGVSVVSCYDIDRKRAEEFAKKFSIPHVASSVEELLTRVDAASVVTPDRFHASGALAVLKAGKHLLCEKPLTVTLAEARQLAAAAKKGASKGVIAFTNFSYRSSAAVWKAAELVASGKLGKIRHVHALYLQTWLTSRSWGHWSDGWLAWRLQTKAGSKGVLADLGCHMLDMTTAVAGELESVQCTTTTFPKVLNGKEVTHLKGAALDANDTAIIQMKFKDGAVGVAQTSRWATGYNNKLRLEIHGTKGAVMLDLDRSYEKLDVCLGKDVDSVTWKTLDLKKAPNVWQLFIKSIQSGKQGQPSLKRGAQVQAYLDACERSARSGRVEKIPTV